MTLTLIDTFNADVWKKNVNDNFIIFFNLKKQFRFVEKYINNF